MSIFVDSAVEEVHDKSTRSSIISYRFSGETQMSRSAEVAQVS